MPVVAFDIGSQTSRAVISNGQKILTDPAEVASQVAMTDQLLVGKAAQKELETRHLNVYRHHISDLRGRKRVKLVHTDGTKEIDPELALAVVMRKVYHTTTKKALSMSSCHIVRDQVLPVAITIPVALTSVEISRLKIAAKLAGLPKPVVIPSPIAIAQHYVVKSKSSSRPSTVLVVDCGHNFTSASSVDISDLRTGPKIICSRAIRMAGSAMNDSLQLFIKPTLDSASVRCHPVLIQNAVERVKKDLSSLREATLSAKSVNINITRSELRNSVEGTLSEIRSLVQTVLKRTPQPIRNAILAGGCGRMQCIKDIITTGGGTGTTLTLEVTDYDSTNVQGAACWLEAYGEQSTEGIPSEATSFRYFCTSDTTKEVTELFTKDADENLPPQTSCLFQQLRCEVNEKLPSYNTLTASRSWHNKRHATAAPVDATGLVVSDVNSEHAYYTCVSMGPPESNREEFETGSNMYLSTTSEISSRTTIPLISSEIVCDNGKAYKALEDALQAVDDESRFIQDLSEARNLLDAAIIRIDDIEDSDPTTLPTWLGYEGLLKIADEYLAGDLTVEKPLSLCAELAENLDAVADVLETKEFETLSDNHFRDVHASILNALSQINKVPSGACVPSRADAKPPSKRTAAASSSKSRSRTKDTRPHSPINGTNSPRQRGAKKTTFEMPKQAPSPHSAKRRGSTFDIVDLVETEPPVITSPTETKKHTKEKDIKSPTYKSDRKRGTLPHSSETENGSSSKKLPPKREPDLSSSVKDIKSPTKGDRRRGSIQSGDVENGSSTKKLPKPELESNTTKTINKRRGSLPTADIENDKTSGKQLPRRSSPPQHELSSSVKSPSYRNDKGRLSLQQDQNKESIPVADTENLSKPVSEITTPKQDTRQAVDTTTSIKEVNKQPASGSRSKKVSPEVSIPSTDSGVPSVRTPVHRTDVRRRGSLLVGDSDLSNQRISPEDELSSSTRKKSNNLDNEVTKKQPQVRRNSRIEEGQPPHAAVDHLAVTRTSSEDPTAIPRARRASFDTTKPFTPIPYRRGSVEITAKVVTRHDSFPIRNDVKTEKRRNSDEPDTVTKISSRESLTSKKTKPKDSTEVTLRRSSHDSTQSEKDICSRIEAEKVLRDVIEHDTDIKHSVVTATPQRKESKEEEELRTPKAVAPRPPNLDERVLFDEVPQRKSLPPSEGRRLSIQKGIESEWSQSPKRIAGSPGDMIFTSTQKINPAVQSPVQVVRLPLSSRSDSPLHDPLQFVREFADKSLSPRRIRAGSLSPNRQKTISQISISPQVHGRGSDRQRYAVSPSVSPSRSRKDFIASPMSAKELSVKSFDENRPSSVSTHRSPAVTPRSLSAGRRSSGRRARSSAPRTERIPLSLTKTPALVRAGSGFYQGYAEMRRKSSLTGAPSDSFSDSQGSIQQRRPSPVRRNSPVRRSQSPLGVSGISRRGSECRMNPTQSRPTSKKSNVQINAFLDIPTRTLERVESSPALRQGDYLSTSQDGIKNKKSGRRQNLSQTVSARSHFRFDTGQSHLTLGEIPNSVGFISGGGEHVEFVAPDPEEKIVELRVNGSTVLRAVMLKYDTRKSQLIAYRNDDLRGTGGQVPQRGKNDFLAKLFKLAVSVGVRCKGFETILPTRPTNSPVIPQTTSQLQHQKETGLLRV